MNARFLVLGMLHWGDLHPYEIKRRAEAAMVGCYLAVEVGTLYYAIRQLEKQGAITPTSQERVPRGGIRTIYRITPSGRATFQEDYFGLFTEDGPVSQTLYGALLFMHRVDRTRLIEAIRAKLARMDDLIAKLAPLHTQMAPALTTGGEHLFRHIEQQRQLDRTWLAALLRDLAPEAKTPPAQRI